MHHERAMRVYAYVAAHPEIRSAMAEKCLALGAQTVVALDVAAKFELHRSTGQRLTRSALDILGFGETDKSRVHDRHRALAGWPKGRKQ